MSHALVTAFTGDCRSLAAEIVTALQGTNVSTGESEYAPRVLAFSETGAAQGDALADTLAAMSERGARRILAVAGSARACPPDRVWRLLRGGASDVVVWNGAASGPAVAARLTRWLEIEEFIRRPEVARMVVGQSPAWHRALRRVVEVARWSRAAVLITGESGTGKELVARLIHELRPDSGQGGLVVVDGTTVVPTLSGSEFFGHERGAFTGAVGPRDGAFALADRGTLFLDEVGELPVTMQAELLRVVQEGTYKRVGSNVWRHTAFRLVCATNRDLVNAERDGSFRSDFYHRISATRVHLPALDERREDILPLFRHFLGLLLPNGTPAEITPEVEAVIAARRYSGNVRDLRALALRVAARHVGPGPITPGDLPEEERPPPADGAGLPAGGPPGDDLLDHAVGSAVAAGATLQQIRESAVDSAIRAALAQCGGRMGVAAKRLGVTGRALQLRRARQRDGPEPATPI